MKQTNKTIHAQFAALGADASKAELAHPEACMLFGKLVNEGVIVAEDDKALMARAMECVRSFHEAKSIKNKMPADESLKIGAHQYKLFASPKVFAVIADIDAAVTAFTSKKTKKQMGGKGYFEILKSTASRVSKAKDGETVPLTAKTFDAIVAGKKADADGGVVKSPADIAKGALKSGLAAALKDGGFSKAKQKAIRDFAETLGIEL